MTNYLNTGVSESASQGAFATWAAYELAGMFIDKALTPKLSKEQQEAVREKFKEYTPAEWACRGINHVLNICGIGAIFKYAFSTTATPWALGTGITALVAARVLKSGFHMAGFDFDGAEGRKNNVLAEQVALSTATVSKKQK